MNNGFRSRRLTLTISTISLVLNLLAVYFLQYLPNDPQSIVRYSTIYSCFAAVVSLGGICGCIKANQTLISILSNQLLLDAIILTLPRIVILRLLIPFTTNICATGSPFLANNPNAWPANPTPDLPLNPSPNTNTNTVTFADNLSITPRIWETWDRESCCFAIRVAQGMLGVLCVVMPAAQWWCALRTREYARMLAGREESGRLAEEKDEREKAEC